MQLWRQKTHHTKLIIRPSGSNLDYYRRSVSPCESLLWRPSEMKIHSLPSISPPPHKHNVGNKTTRVTWHILILVSLDILGLKFSDQDKCMWMLCYLLIKYACYMIFTRITSFGFPSRQTNGWYKINSHHGKSNPRSRGSQHRGPMNIIVSRHGSSRRPSGWKIVPWHPCLRLVTNTMLEKHNTKCDVAHTFPNLPFDIQRLKLNLSKCVWLLCYALIKTPT